MTGILSSKYRYLYNKWLIWLFIYFGLKVTICFIFEVDFQPAIYYLAPCVCNINIEKVGLLWTCHYYGGSDNSLKDRRYNSKRIEGKFKLGILLSKMEGAHTMHQFKTMFYSYFHSWICSHFSQFIFVANKNIPRWRFLLYVTP